MKSPSEWADEARKRFGTAMTKKEMAVIFEKCQTELLALLAVLVTRLPVCCGEWIDGSGGHRKHSPCTRPATWMMDGDMFQYCDCHVVEHEKDTQYERVNWADAVNKAYDLLCGEK